MRRFKWQYSVLSLTIITLSSNNLFAGTITGRVYDANTHEPLSGANVVLMGTKFGAAADLDGRYKIQGVPSGIYSIRVTFIGYQSVKMIGVDVRASGGFGRNIVVEVNFYMPSSAIETSEIVLTYKKGGSNYGRDESDKQEPKISTEKFKNSMPEQRTTEQPSRETKSPVKPTIPKEIERGNKLLETLAELPDAAARWLTSSKSVVVTIGINNYQNQKLRKLDYAVFDAQAIRDFFQNKTSFRIYEELYDMRATKNRIEEVVDRLINDKSIDRIIFYFAGHGHTVEASPGSSDIGFFLPVDGDPKKLITTAISMNEVSTWAKALRARHVLFIFDACFSGIVGGSARADRDYNLDFLAENVGRHVITAGTKDDEALEYNNVGHGALTYHLLKGLQGEADVKRDYIITLNELAVYLKDKVPNFTGGKQHPQLIKFFDGDGELFIELIK